MNSTPELHHMNNPGETTEAEIWVCSQITRRRNKSQNFYAGIGKAIAAWQGRNRPLRSFPSGHWCQTTGSGSLCIFLNSGISHETQCHNCRRTLCVA